MPFVIFLMEMKENLLIGKVDKKIKKEYNEEKVMRREFIELPLFVAKWKALNLNDKDLRKLQEALLQNPKIGSVIKGTNGVRKMRFAFEHKGKSGSSRVVYVDFEVHKKIYLISAYAKNEKSNLSQVEKNDIQKLVKILHDQLKRKEK